MLKLTPLHRAFADQILRGGAELAPTAVPPSRALSRSTSNASAEEREDKRISDDVEAVSVKPANAFRPPLFRSTLIVSAVCASVLCCRRCKVPSQFCLRSPRGSLRRRDALTVILRSTLLCWRTQAKAAER